MHHLFAKLLLAADLLSYAQASTLTARAVEPTATGEIGVNPPDDLGDSTHYIGWIGVDTSYLSLDGSTTKWIGVNSEYITEVPTTMTVEDRPVISNIPLQIVASTATVDAEGVVTGDVTLLLSDKFRIALEQEIKEAALSCGAPAKIRKRAEFMSCMIRAGQGSIEEGGGAYELVSPATWERFSLELAQNVPGELAALLQWGGNRVAQNKLRVFAGAVVAAGVGVGMSTGKTSVPPKLKFHAGNVGRPGNGGGTPTTSTCDPTATPNADSPVCTDDDCKGKKRVCTEGKYKGCRCTDWTYVVIEDTYDTVFGDEQQKMLADALQNLPGDGSVPPKCFQNTNGDGFDGKPMAEPSAWCVCTSASSTGIYSTIASQTDPCALSSMPTATIAITNRPEYTGPVTSCKWTTPTFSSVSVGPYCTCNDNKMHGPPVQTTTVEGTETKTICVPPETGVTNPPTPNEPPTVDKPICNGPIRWDEKTKFKSREEVEKFVDKQCEGLTSGTIEYHGQNWYQGPIETTDEKQDIYIQIDIAKKTPACEGKEPEMTEVTKENCKKYLMAPIDKCTNDDQQRGGRVFEECTTWWIGLTLPK